MGRLTVRQESLVHPGLGQHVISPKKRQRLNRVNERASYRAIGKKARLEEIQRRIEHLQTARQREEPEMLASISEEDDQDEQDTPMIVGPEASEEEESHDTKTKRGSGLDQKVRVARFCQRWQELLPAIQLPLLQYTQESLKHAAPTTFTPHTRPCNDVECTSRRKAVLMLFWDHFETQSVEFCECRPLPVVLVRSGLFPTAPVDPQMAVSVDLLDFYAALFQRSGDAITAVAGALSTFYDKRGFPVIGKKGEPIRDPFRKTLAHAVQWHGVLRMRIERAADAAVHRVKRALAGSDVRIEGEVVDATRVREEVSSPMLSRAVQLVSATRSTPATPAAPSSHLSTDRSHCALILQDRCPACFGGNRFGQQISSGGDIHVAIDASFSHRHLRRAGDAPSFFEPSYILPKAFVDAVGTRIESLRKKPPKSTYVPKLPDAVVDMCASGLVAADPSKSKTDHSIFDDTALAALVCRHEIPLFVANVDSPGEQQKYAIALIEHLFSLLPMTATVSVFYDIGCVLDRSLSQYAILPTHIMKRLAWATSAMHSYTHEWACQLLYGPRFQIGLSLTCGEGVERLWSKLRIIIGVTRTSARSRRLWIIDRLLKAIGRTARDDLAVCLKRRTLRADNQHTLAIDEMVKSNVSEPQLQQQWELQKKDQTSIRKHAPARMKKEIDAILSLQAEVEKLTVTISSTRSHVLASKAAASATQTFDILRQSRDDLSQQVNDLYTSLNIDGHFPNLTGVSRDAMRLLLLARDLKINIRKRAASNFMEWDRLSTACGGADAALGTKLHQSTRQKIAKRKPALISAIKKFNGYCEQLRKIPSLPPNIHLPRSLPVELSALRNDTSLMQDVWISSQLAEQPPQWLSSADVRQGIYAMHKRDRSLEERRRCGQEADNMCYWFGNELIALEIALHLPENALYASQLQQRREELLALMIRWQSPLVSKLRYETHLKHADDISRQLREGNDPLPSLTWLPPQTLDEAVLELSEGLNDNDATGIVGDYDDLESCYTEAELADTDALGDFISDESDNGDEDEDEKEDEDEDDGRLFYSDNRRLATDEEPALQEDLTIAQPDFRNHMHENPTTFSIDPFTDILATRYPEPSHLLLGRLRKRDDDKEQSGIIFDPPDIARLARSTAWLNDTCINECAQLLYEAHHSPFQPPMSIFSSFLFSHINEPRTLERYLKWTLYWEHDIWLIPRHRNYHWTLVIVIVSRRQIFTFDSFGSRKSAELDTDDTLTLLGTLRSINRREIPGDEWESQPLNSEPLQTNGYDCGVWVLAVMTAIFRGYHTVGITEADVQRFRKLLLHYVSILPLK